MAKRYFLSADLGAESGRVMLGGFDGTRLSVEEAHRFDSRPVRVPDGLHTDVLRIFTEVKAGMAAAAAAARGEIGGVAVDTWGVDFALVDARGGLLGNPYHYRDIIGEPVDESAFRGITRERLYERTGVALTSITTLYQLLRMRLRQDAALDAADALLMMPDLFTCWLTGRRTNEFTIATTSQCYDPARRAWALDLLRDLGLPSKIFGTIVTPGSIVGELLPDVADEAGTQRVPVIAAGGHDTALAVAAVPARSGRFAYLSSGTWSLLGTELPAPCIDERSRTAGFTNEGGVGGTTRFLKNLCGLWIVQECRRTWSQGGRADSYDDLTRQAAAAPAWNSRRRATCRGGFRSIAARRRSRSLRARVRSSGACSTASRSSTARYSPSWRDCSATRSRRCTSLEAVRETRCCASWRQTRSDARCTPARSKRPRRAAS
jgi:rhamnulokinase